MFKRIVGTTSFDVQFKKIIKHYKRMEYSMATMRQSACLVIKVRNKAMIMNRYNQVQHLTQDTIWDNNKTTRKHRIKKSQEVSPFPAGEHRLGTVSKKITRGTKHVLLYQLHDMFIKLLAWIHMLVLFCCQNGRKHTKYETY